MGKERGNNSKQRRLKGENVSVVIQTRAEGWIQKGKTHTQKTGDGEVRVERKNIQLQE